MTSKYKALGLALTGFLALSALPVQSASASPLTVGSALTTVYVTGDKESQPVYAFPGGSVSCSTSHFHGSGAASSGAVNELTVETTMSECTMFGFANADAKMNGCTDTFTTPTHIEVGKVTWSGATQYHILCPAEKKIELTPTSFGVSVCTLFIPSQTPTGGHIVGRNVAGSSPMDVTFEYTLEGLHYTGTGGVCGNSETHSDGKYSGNYTVTCFSDPSRMFRTDCTFS
jgi:hypothetical protein